MRTHPFGPSPPGRSYGDTPWETAYQLHGSQQLGLAKELLSRYAWWRLEPHPEWVEPHWSKEKYILPYAAGIPGELRVAFVPPMWNSPRLRNLERGVVYHAFFFNPATGKQYPVGRVTPDAEGAWQPPVLPTFADWVVVLERSSVN